MRPIFPVLLCLISLLLASGCWKPIPQPQPVPTGMRVELVEVALPGDPDPVTAVHPETGAPVTLKKTPLIKTSEVATVQRIEPKEGAGGMPSQTQLGIELTPAGATKMSQATASPVGQEIALVVNGQIIAIAQVRGTITNKMVVSGGLEDFEVIVDELTQGE